MRDFKKLLIDSSWNSYLKLFLNFHTGCMQTEVTRRILITISVGRDLCKNEFSIMRFMKIDFSNNRSDVCRRWLCRSAAAVAAAATVGGGGSGSGGGSGGGADGKDYY